MRFHLKIFIFIVTIASCLFQFGLANASIGISPGWVGIEKAMRGQEFKKPVVIINRGEKDISLTIDTLEKPFDEWLFLEDTRSKKPIGKNLQIPTDSTKSFSLLIRIPNDAPNGLHTTRIAFKQTSSDKNSNNVALSLLPSIAINIDVTDKQTINTSLMGFEVEDVEEEEPLRFYTDLSNESNVEISPTLRLEIFDANNNQIKEVAFGMQSIKRDQTGREDFTLSMSNLRIGRYRAKAVIEFADYKSDESISDFKVLPKGTLTVGQLETLELEPKGPYSIGQTATLVGVFQNSSPKYLKTKLVADVYRDGYKIGSAESQPQGLISGDKIRLTAKLKIDKTGEYSIDGYCVFSEKESNHKKVSFKVKSKFIPYEIAGAIIITSLILFTLIRGRRKKKSRTQAPHHGHRIQNP